MKSQLNTLITWILSLNVSKRIIKYTIFDKLHLIVEFLSPLKLDHHRKTEKIFRDVTSYCWTFQQYVLTILPVGTEPMTSSLAHEPLTSKSSCKIQFEQLDDIK